jgi:hypothetical protein
MKNFISIFGIGCILCIASYFLPWLQYNDKISWAGNNISNVTKYFSDGKNFKTLFNLTHIVFAGSIICLILLGLQKNKAAKWIGLIISVLGLISYVTIKLALHEKTFMFGFTLGIVGLIVCFLQSFIKIFHRPLIK